MSQFMAEDHGIVIKVLLVNGESRSVKLVENTEVTDIIYYILTRLQAKMDISPMFFGILLCHTPSGEHHWLTPGYSVLDLIASHCGTRPLEQWRFFLRIRVLPKTPQHLFSQDPVAFSYYYDQVLHMYLEDDSIVVDNDTALKLGCLEIRRFFRDTSEQALKRKENIAMLEREYGFQRFFKKSFLQCTRKRNLNKMIQSMFQQFESLTRDGCIFQFFAILGRFYPLDSECFNNCAIGEDSAAPLTINVSIGPTCEVEYETELGDRRHIVSFKDIHEIRYEPEFTTRGRVILEMKTSSPVVIRTAQLVTAVHMVTLIDGYCQVYTTMPHSRISNLSDVSYISEQDSMRANMQALNEIPFDPRSFQGGYSTVHSNNTGRSDEGDYATVGDPDKLLKTLGRPLSPRNVLLGERIGEGQFGDVHTGMLYPDSTEEARVAVKTCKPDSAPEEKAKFLQEAAVMKQFNHPHIIKLFGVVTQGFSTYIVMELAPLGQLRQYLIQKDKEISRSTLLEYIRQLCSAMVHLESKNYVHRDIAARNVLVVAPDKIKLSDFGLSRWLEEADFYVASRGKLPIKWMAPESINFRRFTGSSDVWMFGVCCWEILMRGVKPFMGIKNDEVIGKLELGERLSMPLESPGPLFNLMIHCWQYDSEDRPTFRDLEQQIEYILEEELRLTKSIPRGRGHDGPPLPPRNPHEVTHNKRRSGDEHHVLLQPSLSSDTSPPPPLPPRLPNGNNGRPLPAEPLSNSPPNRRKPHGSDSSVDPYLITNIPGAVPNSSSSPFSPPINQRPPSPQINRNHSLSPIPPPAILRNQQQQQHQSDRAPPTGEDKRRSDLASEGIYYSTVSGDDETSPDVPISQLKLSREVSPYEISLSKDEMSPLSSTSLDEVQEEEYDEDENNEVLEKTTAVVKSVMSLSTQLPEAQPCDYPELVKGVGIALRELLAKIDQEMDSLPDSRHHTNQKVQMAHKVLSSDMGHLVKAMKDLQENYHSFLVDHYQKQMLQSAAIVAVNSKHLLEAYNKARRYVRQSQR